MAIGVGERQARTERMKQVTLPGLATRKFMVITVVKAIRLGGCNVEITRNKNRPGICRADILTVPEKATVITFSKRIL